MRRALLGMLAILLVFLLSSKAEADDFNVVTHSLRIISPCGSDEACELDAAVSNVGLPNYGGAEMGELVYLSRDACSMDKTAIPRPSVTRPQGSELLPLIVLIDSSDATGCHFVDKAYHAQQAGARVVLVQDSKDEGLEQVEASVQASSATSVHGLRIPAAIITLASGNKLKAMLQGASQAIVVSFEWKYVTPSTPAQKVNWEFWTTSSDGCTSCEEQTNFKRDFHDIAVQFEKDGLTEFTPHYFMQRCITDWGNPECKIHCLHVGRYCDYQPLLEDAKHILNARDYGQVVEENKRQLCMFQQASAAGERWRWWDFVRTMQERCSARTWNFNWDCANAILEEMHFDMNQIHACVGNIGDWHDVDFMEAEMCAKEGVCGGHPRVDQLPAILINGLRYRGPLQPDAVKRAICSGFNDTESVQACMTEDVQTDECRSGENSCDPHAVCRDTFRSYNCFCTAGYTGDGFTCQKVGSGSSPLVVWMAAIAVFAGISLTIAVAKRLLDKDYEKKLNRVIAEYMPLDSGPDSDPKPYSEIRPSDPEAPFSAGPHYKQPSFSSPRINTAVQP